LAQVAYERVAARKSGPDRPWLRSTPFGSFQKIKRRAASYSINSLPRLGRSPSGLGRCIRADFSASMKRAGLRLAISRARACGQYCVLWTIKGEAPQRGAPGASRGPLGGPCDGGGKTPSRENFTPRQPLLIIKSPVCFVAMAELNLEFCVPSATVRFFLSETQGSSDFCPILAGRWLNSPSGGNLRETGEALSFMARLLLLLWRGFFCFGNHAQQLRQLCLRSWR